MSRRRMQSDAQTWDSCDVVTGHLVLLHRGERNVDKLCLGFDYRLPVH